MTDLDATLRQLTGYRLQRATGVSTLRHKSVFAAHGLRRTTFSCLSLIVDTPGLRQSQLGETLAIERPNLVKIVEDLVKAGLIRREKSKADSRAYALYPTSQGTHVFQDALAEVREVNARMTDGLSETELSVLHKALSLIEGSKKA